MQTTATIPSVREHHRLLADSLSAKAGDLRLSPTRLRALINIWSEFASERASDRRLHNVCTAAHDLFDATYATIGTLDRTDRTLRSFVSCGPDEAVWISAGDAIPGILGAVVAEQRVMRGYNSGGDPADLQLPAGHPGIQAFLAAPIASRAYVYGWICLVRNDGLSFTDDEEGLVEALAGQIGNIFELEHEIGERHQAESDLRQERDRAQSYLDTAEVIMLALDLEGRITLINRKGCDLLGWTEAELLGRDWIETCLPLRTRGALTQKFQALVDGDLSTVENPILAKSGEERLIEWCNTLLRDDQGRVIGTFSSGTDISKRKRAADALRTAEERMRFALEAAGVGIWDMHYATGVLQWSEILEAQYGLQPGTFGGTLEAFTERVHPADRASVVATLAAAEKAGADFSVLHRTLWPDGTVRWLSGAGRIVLAADGTPVRGIGVSIDVTARQTLEAQYRQAQKMEAIGRLAGGVAHDFNNLLTVILGHCELLLEDLDPQDSHRADIGDIQKAGLSAAALTRRMLTFSRKQMIEPSRLDLNLVLADMRDMLVRLIGEDIKVIWELRRDLSPIKADRGQMEQIVLNLAVNARDAMPGGGTLTIETANLEIDEQFAKTRPGVKPGSYVVLTVSDTGAGMTPAVQARLFEPFFTTKEVGKGTGLGLATVHGIVMQSAGSIDVSSEVGIGTSFKMYFPVSAALDCVVDSATPGPRMHTRPPSEPADIKLVRPGRPTQMPYRGPRALVTLPPKTQDFRLRR